MSGISSFDPLTITSRKVAIVATGPSAYGVRFDFGPDVHVIAVKGAIHGVKAHSWITVDPNPRSVRMMNARVAGVGYYAAVPRDYGTMDARIIWHRVPLVEGIHWLERLNEDGLSEDPRRLHSGNSAYGALGLAYLMGAKHIALFGVDATRDQYGIGPGRPRGSMDHVPPRFRSAVPQLNRAGVTVINASSISRIDCFERMKPQGAVEWLKDA